MRRSLGPEGSCASSAHGSLGSGLVAGGSLSPPPRGHVSGTGLGTGWLASGHGSLVLSRGVRRVTGDRDLHNTTLSLSELLRWGGEAWMAYSWGPWV